MVEKERELGLIAVPPAFRSIFIPAVVCALGLFACAVLVLRSGAPITLHPGKKEWGLELGRMLALACAAMFGAGLWVSLRRLSGWMPALMIDDAGIVDAASEGRAGRVRWCEIAEVERVADQLVIHLTDVGRVPPSRRRPHPLTGGAPTCLVISQAALGEPVDLVHAAVACELRRKRAEV